MIPPDLLLSCSDKGIRLTVCRVLCPHGRGIKTGSSGQSLTEKARRKSLPK
nr:MAG TPA: hypothetical protein [Caudoviricetes sp.]